MDVARCPRDLEMIVRLIVNRCRAGMEPSRGYWQIKDPSIEKAFAKRENKKLQHVLGLIVDAFFERAESLHCFFVGWLT